jgi:hypothetical protein
LVIDQQGIAFDGQQFALDLAAVIHGHHHHRSPAGPGHQRLDQRKKDYDQYDSPCS